MRNLLIIYPHWPPSNLAGVHRPRLIANFLPELGWHPIVLTVSSEYYEEESDLHIASTASDKIEVVYTKAFPVSKPRLIGDIGLRAFPHLLKEALNIISSRKIDFIWIPIPSFYTALLGRILFHKTNVPYGVDYIDPWVRDISNRKNLRARLSILTAQLLEPIAVKHASLISGVSTAYYEPVLQRNFRTKKVTHIGMPYGFDPKDHSITIPDLVLPWEGMGEIKPIVYAGAFLPNSHFFIKALFKSLKKLISAGKWDSRMHFFFLGTGAYAGTSIADYALQYGVEDFVTEIRDRFPYLHVLNFLAAAHTVLVVGSTEKHYTASKTYQALLSKRPVLAIFHKESSAVKVLEECNADSLLVRYKNNDTLLELEEIITEKLQNFVNNHFTWSPKLEALDKYSAKASAQALVQKIQEVI